MAQWVYKRTEPGLYTVGFYDPNGKWYTESDWPSSEEAAQRVHYLNGGKEKYHDENHSPRSERGA